MPKIKVFTAEHHDPWFNLATEDWLFKNFPDDHHVLFLWRNKPCIVIGRFQNPWNECDLTAMDRDGNGYSSSSMDLYRNRWEAGYFGPRPPVVLLWRSYWDGWGCCERRQRKDPYLALGGIDTFHF